jgi:hypothetical protein
MKWKAKKSDIKRSKIGISSDSIDTKKWLIYLLNEIIGNLTKLNPKAVNEIIEVILPFCADEKYKVVL